jgi:hypothetical protein|eukprot:COSAG06_NODE_8649_length_2106_cov_23.025411_2_plen_125_part_00
MYVHRKNIDNMGDFFTGLSYGDQLEMGTAVVGGGVDYETLNAMLRQEMDERALATQVQKYGPGHGRDAVSQAVAPGATPPEGGQVASNTSAASYEVLVPEPGKLPTRDATKEPTYRLRKAMKLV